MFNKYSSFSLKIVFYNIGYGTGLNGSLRHYFLKSWRYLWTPLFNTKKLYKILDKSQADVICLAEVDGGSIRNRFFSQIKRVAENLKVEFADSSPKYHPKSLFKFIPLMRKQHDAILSKTRGKKINHYLTRGAKKLVQEFIVDGKSIFTVHLGLLRSSLRKNQLKELSTLLKSCPRPHILCGDFNIYKGLKEIKHFLKDANVQRVEIPASFPSVKPKKYLDLFFVSDDIEVKNAGTLNTNYSDHLPIWIEI